MARIENHKYTVAEAFRECFYVVPDYQREYVWTEREVRQLLDDIDEQIETGTDKEYFIGTVLVAPPTSGGAPRNHLNVIDGQQRLTTFFLLLCALRVRFAGQPQTETLDGLVSTSYVDRSGNSVKSMKLDPRYECASDLLARIVEIGGEPDIVRSGVREAGIPKFGSLENLLDAYATIWKYLADNHDTIEKLRRFWGYLANNVVFIQISTDVSSALKIFETINERGVGLNPMDLLKNLLFTHVRDDEFTALKNEWKKVTKPLEVAKQKPLRFLRYFLMANYAIKNARNDRIVREDEIYDWFLDKQNIALCGYVDKPFEFVRKIARSVEHYLAFIDGKANDGTSNSAMDSLRLLCGGAFSQHHVLLLAVANWRKPLFEHFVRQLESFLFYYIFTKSPTKDLEKSFSLWADELREIGAMPNSAQQIQRLNVFLESRFLAGMKEKEPELRDALKRYTLSTMQQYRTRYLLAKLTQNVDMAYKGLKTAGPLSDYTVLEIEHILPNTPTDALRAAFEETAGEHAYDDYKNRLGNLTLLEKPINITAGNDFYQQKVSEYRKSKNYLTSSLAEIMTVGINSSINRINQHLQAYDVWTSATIEDRHQKLIELALQVWRTELMAVPGQHSEVERANVSAA